MGTIEPKFWQELCSLIGREDLANRQFDFAHGEELEQTLAKVFLLKTQKEWLSLIDDRDFCVTPVCSLDEALNSELTSESDMVDTRNEDIGEVRYLQPAIKLSATPGTIDLRAPRLGEHREEILSSLGYTAEEISKLKADHVI